MTQKLQSRRSGYHDSCEVCMKCNFSWSENTITFCTEVYLSCPAVNVYQHQRPRDAAVKTRWPFTSQLVQCVDLLLKADSFEIGSLNNFSVAWIKNIGNS